MKSICFQGISCILLPFSIALCFISLSCTNPTESTKGRIVGRIVQEGPVVERIGNETETSEFRIALYASVEEDTTLQRLANETFRGFNPIGNITSFDHRTNEPFAITRSSTNGSFEFNGVPSGDYNVAVVREGWSIRYLYDVTVYSDEITDIGDIHINPAVIMGTYSNEQFTFRSGLTYIFENDSSIIGNVSIESGSMLFVEPGKTIRFYGDITCPNDDWWKIDSSFSMYNMEAVTSDSTHYFNGVYFFEPALQIKNLLVRNAFNAISSNADSLDIERCVMYNIGSGVALSNGSLNASNLLLYSGFSTAIQVIGIERTCSIDRSVFYQLDDAISIYTDGQTSIQNCCFEKNNYAVRATSAHGAILNCEFSNNYIDIYMERSMYNISYNNFDYSKYLSIYPGARSATQQSIVNNNNFFRTDYIFISIRAGSPAYTNVYQDFNATNNYWLPVAVDQYLLDANDNSSYPTTPCPRTIIYMPRRSSPISSAGVIQ